MNQFKETKELLKFLIALVEAGFQAGADGKVTVGDYPALIPALMAAPNAFAGLNLIGVEYQSASEEQRLEFHSELAQEFDIPNDRVELLIERVLTHTGGLFVAVNEFVETGKAA